MFSNNEEVNRERGRRETDVREFNDEANKKACSRWVKGM